MLRKVLSLFAALALLLSIFAFATGSVHAATSPKVPVPPVNPNCQTSQITDLHQNHFYFRTQINCAASSSRIASIVRAQYITRQDSNWATSSVSTQSDCSYCNGLLNPKSGGLAVLDVAGYPSGTCFRVYETFSYNFNGQVVNKNVAGGDKCK